MSADVSSATDEDTSVEIILSGSDIDSSDLSYLVDENSSNGDVSITDNIATFTPDLDFNGTTTFTYLVTDGELTSNGSIVTIIVDSVNDSPVLDFILDQAIDEDGVLSLTLSGSDVDADDLTYSASVDGNASVDVVGTQLTVTPDSDYNGSITVSVNVTDGEYVDSQDFVLTVNAVNDAPVLTTIDDQVIDEDGVLSLTLSGSDVDLSLIHI